MSTYKISPPVGATNDRKRLGRGRGSGHGKTAGRGTKGQGSRTGSGDRAWFEGGQMPLSRRLPKRGFKPISRTVFQIVNLGSLTQISAGAKVTPLELSKLGYIKDPNGLVKILGDGELKVSASFHAHAFSQSAEAKIVQAGGTVNILPRFEETADTTA